MPINSSLIQLDEAKSFLNIPTSDVTEDETIASFIDAASNVAQFYCGDLLPTTYTEVHDGGGAAIYTRHTPVLSVTTLTEYIGSITYTLTNQPLGSSTNAWGYTIDDPPAGRIVRRSASGIAWRFVPGLGNVSITYTAGMTEIPEQVYAGISFIVKHLFESQRGAASMPAQFSDTMSPVPGTGYAIPNRAIEMFQTVPRMPVIG